MKINVSLDDVLAAVEADDYIGFCIYCGTEAEGVEPDAERYRCHNCEEFGVYGAEDLLIRMVP